MKFRPIEKGQAEIIIIRKHYLHRTCPISWAFGAFVDEQLRGVLTIGKPCSRTVCEGVCGKERAADVYELNRLWLDDCLPRNSESQFIGWCLRELRKMRPSTILISYADSAQNHIGIVYQATNWIYTGTSTPFADKVRGQRIERSIKHRYTWFANPRDCVLLRWPVTTYPKSAVSQTAAGSA
jgi:hypothetical protein